MAFQNGEVVAADDDDSAATAAVDVSADLKKYASAAAADGVELHSFGDDAGGDWDSGDRTVVSQHHRCTAHWAVGICPLIYYHRASAAAAIATANASASALDASAAIAAAAAIGAYLGEVH